MSTGCRAGVLQRQLPLSVFWNANAFSILNLRATEKPSLIPGNGFAPPDFESQHIPVQLEAIGLQTANGERTIISTAAVTSALCSATSLSISKTPLTLRKLWQVLAEWICATHRSTPSASGRGVDICRPKTRLGSPLAAIISAVFWLMYSARQPADDDSSCSGTLSLSSRSHFRSRALVHRAYSANASLASSSFNLAIRARTRLLSSASAIASEGSLQISSPAVVLVARQSKFG